eukprot:SAG11_NODE_28181_length_324_cov_1.333333_1_plen_43_part_00
MHLYLLDMYYVAGAEALSAAIMAGVWYHVLPSVYYRCMALYA